MARLHIGIDPSPRLGPSQKIAASDPPRAASTSAHARLMFLRIGPIQAQLGPTANDRFFIREDDLEFELDRDAAGTVVAIRDIEANGKFAAEKPR